MSLFGSSPTAGDGPPTSSAVTTTANAFTPSRRGRTGLGGFLEDSTPSPATHSGLFDSDDDHNADAPTSTWPPTPRKDHDSAETAPPLLKPSEVPASYSDFFEAVARQNQNGSQGRVGPNGIALLFAAAELGDDHQARITSLVTGDDISDILLSRDRFNLLLALIGLAQEGSEISLEALDKRRTALPLPKLPGLTSAKSTLPPVAELAAKSPQTPANAQPSMLRSAMDDPEADPWNSPELHKGHAHSKPSNGHGDGQSAGHPNHFGRASSPIPGDSQHGDQHTAATSTTAEVGTSTSGSAPLHGGWGHFPSSGAAAPHGFSQSTLSGPPPFGGDGGHEAPNATAVPDEVVVVNLLPTKEGFFMFQHHNYEVLSQRRASKVVRRYSDFVWLLDCLHKRYPFRVLPLLPPKRVAVNGKHLSNDGAFIEKRRRGLARFLNALVAHPVLSMEQLVVMFLTVPTELAVWRKQATITVQDEFTNKELSPGLQDSLPPTLEELLARTRSGVCRSAKLYIHVCNIMDRLVKRTEGVAADHGRIAQALSSLTEASADTYATDSNEVPLLNDGLAAMSKHLQACQALLEDESRGWDEGVLEDLKRQRDALVGVRDLFDRRERLDKDNIPQLERRIQANEAKLASLRSKPEGSVKAGEIDKTAASIIKDKESIVEQHNRSIFVRECLRDELVTFQATQYRVSRWSQDWAAERVKYAEMLADNWRRLMDELEGMPLGD